VIGHLSFVICHLEVRAGLLISLLIREHICQPAPTRIFSLLPTLPTPQSVGCVRRQQNLAKHEKCISVVTHRNIPKPQFLNSCTIEKFLNGFILEVAYRRLCEQITFVRNYRKGQNMSFCRRLVVLQILNLFF
jgi:hypothetical protein